jgi:hypothetical protein
MSSTSDGQTRLLGLEKFYNARHQQEIGRSRADRPARQRSGPSPSRSSHEPFSAGEFSPHCCRSSIKTSGVKGFLPAVNCLIHVRLCCFIGSGSLCK